MSDTVVEMPKKRRRTQPKATQDPADLPPDPRDPTAPVPPSRPPVKVSSEPLPMPPKFNCSPPEFFRYWDSLETNERARVIVYPYRNWPKMDYTRGLSPEQIRAIAKGEEKGPLSNLGPLSEPFPFESWREQVLHLWGSGAYHLKLNDTGVRGDKSLKPRPLCQTNTGDVIDPNYPPVLDLEKLDIFADTNASYLRDLKLKGVRIPGITEDEQENTDMAGAAAAETMANAVKDLTGQVVNMAKSTAEAKHNQPHPVDVSGQAQLKASEIIAEASKESIRMVTEAAKRDATANDPKAYVQDLVTMANIITPKAQTSGPDPGMFQLLITQMQDASRMQMEQARQQRESDQRNHEAQMQMMRQSHEANLKAIESRLNFTETLLKERLNPATPATGAVPATADPFALFGKFLDAVDKFNERRDGAATTVAEGPAWLKPAAAAVTAVANAVQTGFYNNAVAKTGNGQPVAPIVQDAEFAELPGAGDPETEEQMYGNFLKEIEPHLLNALNNNVPGHVFAAELAMSRGMIVYNQLAAGGESGIYQFISRYNQGLWQQLSKMPQKFTQFVQEFLNQAEVARAFEEMQIARQNASMPPEPPKPAVVKPAPPRPKAATPMPQAVVDAQKQS